MRRRSFLLGMSASAVASASPTAAQRRVRTPGQILGPYYPIAKPLDSDLDLTTVAGRTERAAGQIIRIMGRVLNEAGEAVPGASIEVWQADANGHYAHPSDKSRGVSDPNFQGYATLKSDKKGGYQFTTVKPGCYPDDGAGGMRAPHIHFQVTGTVNRLVTQMYFDGEDLNETDRVLAFAQAGRDRLIVKLDPGSNHGRVPLANWDIVLRNG